MTQLVDLVHDGVYVCECDGSQCTFDDEGWVVEQNGEDRSVAAYGSEWLWINDGRSNHAYIVQVNNIAFFWYFREKVWI